MELYIESKIRKLTPEGGRIDPATLAKATIATNSISGGNKESPRKNFIPHVAKTQETTFTWMTRNYRQSSLK